MKKVVYSITKLGKVENTKITGVGYITDEDLITANISKIGKPYIRIYSCVKNCHPIPNSTDEFKGTTQPKIILLKSLNDTTCISSKIPAIRNSFSA